MAAGIPKEASAWGLNSVCGSGLRAIAIGMQQIATGDAKIIAAGGQESMSLSPHCAHLRAGVKMGDYKMIDTMIMDGLWDAFNGYHMGMTAETSPSVPDHARRSGPVRAGVPEQGRGRAEGGSLQGRDRRGDDPRQEGRHDRRRRRVYPPRRHHGCDDESCVPPSTRRLGHRSQRVRHQTMALPARPDERSRGGPPRHHTDRPDRLLGHGRRRSRRHGDRPIPALRRALGEKAAGRSRSRPGRGQRSLRCAGLLRDKDMGWNPEIVNVNGGAIAIGHPWGFRRTHLQHARPRDEAPRREEGPGRHCASAGGMGVAMCVEAMN